jgi:hypothetical protein
MGVVFSPVERVLEDGFSLLAFAGDSEEGMVFAFLALV